MAGDAKKLQPIIVKRVRKGGHAPHGGAWKIAYADFVTAMMAFFLLMWLLGSTTEGDKKGIADFFQSPLRVALLGGGSGSGDSSSLVKGGGTDLTRSEGQVKQGDVKVARSKFDLHKLREERRRAEAAQLRGLQQRIEDMLSGDPRLAPYRSQIKIDFSRDGLRVQVLEEQNRPMFDSGSAVLKPQMREILRAIGSVLADVPNRLTLEGHTDAQLYASGDRGYSNWELSADRANASRRELVAGGLTDERVLRVQGLASSQPLNRADPLDARNRRISIVVMNRDAEERFFGTGSDDEPEATTERPAAPDPAAR